MNNFFKSDLSSKLDKTPAQRGLTPGKLVYLFAYVSGDAVAADTVTLSYACTPAAALSAVAYTARTVKAMMSSTVCLSDR